MLSTQVWRKGSGNLLFLGCSTFGRTKCGGTGTGWRNANVRLQADELLPDQLNANPFAERPASGAAAAAAATGPAPAAATSGAGGLHQQQRQQQYQQQEQQQQEQQVGAPAAALEPQWLLAPHRKNAAVDRSVEEHLGTQQALLDSLQESMVSPSPNRLIETMRELDNNRQEVTQENLPAQARVYRAILLNGKILDTACRAVCQLKEEERAASRAKNSLAQKRLNQCYRNVNIEYQRATGRALSAQVRVPEPSVPSVRSLGSLG